MKEKECRFACMHMTVHTRVEGKVCFCQKWHKQLEHKSEKAQRHWLCLKEGEKR